MQKNVVGTLAVILFSVTSLMAHPIGKNQAKKIELELNKDIVNAVAGIANEEIDQQSHEVLAAKVIHSISIKHSILKNKITDKVKTAEKWDSVKYSQLYAAFAELEVFADYEYWGSMSKTKLGQELINVLNKLEEAINNLPTNDERTLFFNEMENTVFYFHYNGKIVNISKLFELAKSYSGNLETADNKLTKANPLELTIEEYAKQNNLE